jgi:hypothetical protein
MFILNTEQCPHTSTTDLGETDEETDKGAVLKVLSINGVKYPIKSEDGIQEHCQIIPVFILISADITKKSLVRVGLE